MIDGQDSVALLVRGSWRKVPSVFGPMHLTATSAKAEVCGAPAASSEIAPAARAAAPRPPTGGGQLGHPSWLLGVRAWRARAPTRDSGDISGVFRRYLRDPVVRPPLTRDK